MANQVSSGTEEAGERRPRRPLFDLTRKVLLAGIGAVSLAQDEIEDFVEKLVERGEIAEQDGRRLVREMVDKRRAEFESGEERLGKRLEDTLVRLNVPTRSDIEHLNERITDLARKIDALQKKQG